MTTKAKRLLVAGTNDSFSRVQKALSESYELQFASTMKEAEDLLRKEGSTGFDMIIAGAHFDDSRMFDLLQLVRTRDHFQNLPFLVVQCRPSAMNIMNSINDVASKLGACGFLELQELPDDEANDLLRKAVLESFDRSVKSERLDKPSTET